MPCTGNVANQAPALVPHRMVPGGEASGLVAPIMLRPEGAQQVSNVAHVSNEQDCHYTLTTQSSKGDVLV